MDADPDAANIVRAAYDDLAAGRDAGFLRLVGFIAAHPARQLAQLHYIGAELHARCESSAPAHVLHRLWARTRDILCNQEVVASMSIPGTSALSLRTMHELNAGITSQRSKLIFDRPLAGALFHATNNIMCPGPAFDVFLSSTAAEDELRTLCDSALLYMRAARRSRFSGVHDEYDALCGASACMHRAMVHGNGRVASIVKGHVWSAGVLEDAVALLQPAAYSIAPHPQPDGALRTYLLGIISCMLQHASTLHHSALEQQALRARVADAVMGLEVFVRDNARVRRYVEALHITMCDVAGKVATVEGCAPFAQYLIAKCEAINEGGAEAALNAVSRVAATFNHGMEAVEMRAMTAGLGLWVCPRLPLDDRMITSACGRGRGRDVLTLLTILLTIITLLLAVLVLGVPPSPLSYLRAAWASLMTALSG